MVLQVYIKAIIICNKVVLQVYIKAIIEGFDEIKIALTEITNNPQDWSDETVAKADGLLQSLESFLFCFCLSCIPKFCKNHPFFMIFYKKGLFIFLMQLVKYMILRNIFVMICALMLHLRYVIKNISTVG